MLRRTQPSPLRQPLSSWPAQAVEQLKGRATDRSAADERALRGLAAGKDNTGAASRRSPSGRGVGKLRQFSRRTPTTLLAAPAPAVASVLVPAAVAMPADVPRPHSPRRQRSVGRRGSRRTSGPATPAAVPPSPTREPPRPWPGPAAGHEAAAVGVGGAAEAGRLAAADGARVFELVAQVHLESAARAPPMCRPEPAVPPAGGAAGAPARRALAARGLYAGLGAATLRAQVGGTVGAPPPAVGHIPPPTTAGRPLTPFAALARAHRPCTYRLWGCGRRPQPAQTSNAASRRARRRCACDQRGGAPPSRPAMLAGERPGRAGSERRRAAASVRRRPGATAATRAQLRAAGLAVSKGTRCACSRK